MRLSIERVHFIGMQMLCHEELVVVFNNHVKIGRRLSTWLGRHVAVQTDDLQVQSEGFMTEQTEIPLDKQGETEFLSANTEHSPPRQPDSKCVTIQLERNKHHYCFGQLYCLKRIEKQHRSAGFSGVFSPPCRHHRHFKTILWKHGWHCSVLLSIGQNRKSHPRLCRRTYFWKEQESDGWTEKTKFSYLVFALRYPYRIRIIS